MPDPCRRFDQPAVAFGALRPQPADSLLALIAAFRDDPRAHKIDLGVGVYRTEGGDTPVMRAVKTAEERLVRDQPTKAYLGPEGNVAFLDRVVPLVFGTARTGPAPVAVQTPGGTGALRLAAELIASGRPGARLLVGTPTWPNHPPILAAAGLETVTYRHVDPVAQAFDIDAAMAAIEAARAGDVALLHGCCHNPTGVDIAPDQWATLARAMAARGVLPLIDLAYQGLGRGLEEDAAGLRTVIDNCGEALVAYSCDKNFGLYRERVGALYAVVPTADEAQVVRSNLLALARANWSMPPDHGGAVVAAILGDPGLTHEWRGELDAMRARIAGVRAGLAAADPTLAPLARQLGMFSMLPLSPAQVARLREDHAIYLPASGRIAVSGLATAAIPRFAAALAAVR